MKQYESNIIEEQDFKERLEVVFSKVSRSLANTFGPYGANTIMAKGGQQAVSKDGWTVLKNIRFADMVAQDILQILIDICAQVNIKVGDGSTSSIVAADMLMKEISGNESFKSIRPKDLLDTINGVTESICSVISTLSTQVDGDNLYDEMYKLALVSTNQDHKTAEIIADIYEQTKNSNIDFVKSKNRETTYEIIEGYKNKLSYIDQIFITNEEGTCELKKPYVLAFDHKIEVDFYFDFLIQQAHIAAATEGRRLLVIAPYYDQLLLSVIQKTVNDQVRARVNPHTVYSKIVVVNNDQLADYNDYSLFLGAKLLTLDMTRELFEKYDEDRAAFSMEFDIKEYLGECEHISLGEMTSLSTGFINPDTEMIKINERAAKSNLKELEAQSLQDNIIIPAIFDVKRRLARMSGRVSVIYVGGSTPLERDANYALVEDAVKACDSAFKHGYNIGGSLIIPIAIKSILETNDNIDPLVLEILNTISNAFKNVFKVVLEKKIDSIDEMDSIITNCVETRQCYNLMTDKYSTEVVNPTFTDIEILKATTSIISLILTSNQYLSIYIERDNV